MSSNNPNVVWGDWERRYIGPIPLGSGVPMEQGTSGIPVRYYVPKYTPNATEWRTHTGDRNVVMTGYEILQTMYSSPSSPSGIGATERLDKESGRLLLNKLINKYKTEIDRQIASIDFPNPRNPPLSLLEKEKRKKYYEVLKKVFENLEVSIINIYDVLNDTALMTALNNYSFDYYSQYKKIKSTFQGIEAINGIQRYYNQLIFIIESIGAIIDSTNFPHLFRQKTAKDTITLQENSTPMDAQGNFINSNGEILDRTEKFVFLGVQNGNLVEQLVRKYNLDKVEVDLKLGILVRPRNCPKIEVVDASTNQTKIIQSKAEARAAWVFQGSDARVSIDCDTRDRRGNPDPNGLLTATIDTKFPSLDELFGYTWDLNDPSKPKINLWEADKNNPVLQQLVQKLYKGQGEGQFLHHQPTGITFANRQEFAEFMEWIIERYSY